MPPRIEDRLKLMPLYPKLVALCALQQLERRVAKLTIHDRRHGEPAFSLSIDAKVARLMSNLKLELGIPSREEATIQNIAKRFGNDARISESKRILLQNSSRGDRKAHFAAFKADVEKMNTEITEELFVRSWIFVRSEIAKGRLPKKPLPKRRSTSVTLRKGKRS